MSRRNKRSNRSIYLKLINILLPLINLSTVAIAQIYTMQATPTTLIKALAYTLVFDAIILLYCETKGDKILTDFVPFLVLLSVPVIGLYSSCLTDSFIYSVVLLIIVSMLGILIDLPLAMLCLFGIFAYTVMFAPGLSMEATGAVLITAILTIMAEYNTTKKAIFLSAGCILFSSLIIILIRDNLELNTLKELPNILFVVLTQAMNILSYILISNRDEQLIEESILTEGSDDGIFEEESTGTAGTEKLSVPDDTNTVAPAINESDNLIGNNLSLELKIDELTNENVELRERIRFLSKSGSLTIEETISLTSEYISMIKSGQPKLYKHCIDIARLSSEAAELINCDTETACAIGLYHEAKRVLGEDYINILINKYRIPKYIVKAVEQIKNVDASTPMLRETGIVILAEDILSTLSYLHTNKKEEVTMERIVNNAIRVRNEKNHLRLAGFTKEEVQLLKLYFNDKGGSYDTAD